MSEIYLTFGKHKGERLQDIPLKYIAWLLTKYEGSRISRQDIEAEAIRRGCEKRNGRWGIVRNRIRSGFDSDENGFGAMAGISREWKNGGEYEPEDQFNDPYNYYGIPNQD